MSEPTFPDGSPVPGDDFIVSNPDGVWLYDINGELKLFPQNRILRSTPFGIVALKILVDPQPEDYAALKQVVLPSGEVVDDPQATEEEEPLKETSGDTSSLAKYDGWYDEWYAKYIEFYQQVLFWLFR